jgi:hypothetical protein
MTRKLMEPRSPLLTKILVSDESRLPCFIINETVYKPASLHLSPQPHKTHRPTHASATIVIPIHIQRPESTHRPRRQEIHSLPQSLGSIRRRTEVTGRTEERSEHEEDGVCYQLLRFQAFGQYVSPYPFLVPVESNASSEVKVA